MTHTKIRPIGMSFTFVIRSSENVQFDLMATFVVVQLLFNPAEKEITNTQTQYNGQT